MSRFDIIQHPLDRFISAGNMAGLDERGRDSADQLMTMIGDLQFCRTDIRGTCARYFIFIETAWFCKLCFTAHIDCVKLQSFLRDIDNALSSGPFNIVDNFQASFCFPMNHDDQVAALDSPAANQSGGIFANDAGSESPKANPVLTVQKPAPKRVGTLENWQRLG